MKYLGEELVILAEIVALLGVDFLLEFFQLRAESVEVVIVGGYIIA
jgi:hypothetical protein